MTGKAVSRLAVQPLEDGESMGNLTTVPEGPTPTQVASALTVLMGLIQVRYLSLSENFFIKNYLQCNIQASVGVLGLDFVTTYFSDELVGGFTTGASMHVFITQLKDITGIYGLPRRDGPANALLVGFEVQ